MDCKVLWCKADYRVIENAAIQCVTTNTKWADGTACGIFEPGVLNNYLFNLFFLINDFKILVSISFSENMYEWKLCT